MIRLRMSVRPFVRLVFARWIISLLIMIAIGFISMPVMAATICGYNDTADKFTGVSGTCRSAPQDGEFNTGSTQYFFDKNINFSCPNASCMLKQGNDLCASIAKMEGRVGTYACGESSACASAPLSQDQGAVGGFVCSGSQVCCVAKTDTGAASSGSGSPTTVNIPDPLQGATVPGLIGNIIKTFAGVAGSIALAIFVFGGFSYIISGGDAGKVKNATAMLRNGAIGIILIFGAYFLTASIISAILVPNK